MATVGNVVWTEEHERLLVSWAERASGYRWLHDKAAKLYDRYGMYINIPASVIGYLSGGTILANAADKNDVLRFVLGFLTIAGGLLANLQATLQYKEFAERHRLSSNHYASFFRNISAELSLEPEFRENPILYIQAKRAEFDKMTEQSPTIPEAIIKRFNQAFAGTSVHKPEITNGLHTIRATSLRHTDGGADSKDRDGSIGSLSDDTIEEDHVVVSIPPQHRGPVYSMQIAATPSPANHTSPPGILRAIQAGIHLRRQQPRAHEPAVTIMPKPVARSALPPLNATAVSPPTPAVESTPSAVGRCGTPPLGLTRARTPPLRGHVEEQIPERQKQ